MHKEKAIYKQIDIIRCQQKLLLDLIQKAQHKHEEQQNQLKHEASIEAQMKPTITFDP